MMTSHAKYQDHMRKVAGLKNKGYVADLEEYLEEEFEIPVLRELTYLKDPRFLTEPGR